VDESRKDLEVKDKEVHVSSAGIVLPDEVFKALEKEIWEVVQRVLN